MAETARKIRAPNSLLLVGDPTGEVPQHMSGKLVASTPGRVAVGTLSDVDGETDVRVLDALTADDRRPIYLAFDGVSLATRMGPPRCHKLGTTSGPRRRDAGGL